MRLEPAPPERTHAVFVISARVGLLIIGIVVGAFILFGWRLTALQHDYTNKIAKTALTTTCESGNDFRALDKGRFDKIVSLFGPPPHRPDLQHAIDVIEGQTKKADVQRDCRHVSVNPPSTTTTTTRATVPSTAQSEGTP